MENNIIFLIILSFFFFILIVALIIIFVSQNNQSLQGCNSDKDCPSGSICKKNDSSIGVCEPKKDTDKKPENPENKNLPKENSQAKNPENKNLPKENSQAKNPENKNPPKENSQTKNLETKNPPKENPPKENPQTKNPPKENSQNKNIVSRSNSAKSETSYRGLNVNKLRKISSDLDSDLESKSELESHFNTVDIHDIYGVKNIENHEEYFCNKEDEYYLCAGIIDVCSFSNFTLFLLENGNIIKETNSQHEKTEIKNNIIFMRIFPFNGYLHAIDRNGYLYSLSNNYLNSIEWKWEKCIWFKDRIKYASTTLDTRYLLLQTYNKGFLFDKAHEQFIKEFDLKM
jgi:hypothetical protein